MTDETENLVLEHLRRIRETQENHSHKLDDLRAQMIHLREDALRREKALAHLEADMERIKIRLDLRD